MHRSEDGFISVDDFYAVGSGDYKPRIDKRAADAGLRQALATQPAAPETSSKLADLFKPLKYALERERADPGKVFRGCDRANKMLLSAA